MFCFSQIGIVCLVIAYAILGAVIFGALEETTEELNRVIVEELRNTTIKQIYTLNKKLLLYEEKNWSHAVDNVLLDFQVCCFSLVIFL